MTTLKLRLRTRGGSLNKVSTCVLTVTLEMYSAFEHEIIPSKSLTPGPDLGGGDVRAEEVVLLDHEVGGARGDGPHRHRGNLPHHHVGVLPDLQGPAREKVSASKSHYIDKTPC